MNTRVLLRGSIVVVAVGILFGVIWAIRESQRPPLPPPNGEESPAPLEVRPSFGQYFTLFFLGRSGDGSRIRKQTPLIRATKFLQGERAGIRAQTAQAVTAPFRIQLRFLNVDTREETETLRTYRQEFTIRPGFFSYCCVRVPKEVGKVTLGIVIDDAFVGYLPITIKEVRKENEGLFRPGR